MGGTLAVADQRPAANAAGAPPWPRTVAQFEALVEAVQDELVHFAFCRLRNLPDAEDAVQEVLIHAYMDRARHCAITQVAPLPLPHGGESLHGHAAPAAARRTARLCHRSREAARTARAATAG